MIRECGRFGRLNSLQSGLFLVFLRGALVVRYHRNRGGAFLIEPLEAFVDQSGARLVALLHKAPMVISPTPQIVALLHAGSDNALGIMFDAHPGLLTAKRMPGYRPDVPLAW